MTLVADRLRLVAGALLLILSPALAAQTALNQMKARKAVTLGYRTDAAPFSMLDAARKPTGYAVELCQLVARRLLGELGLNESALRYQAVPVDQIERYLRGGSVNLLCSATTDTEARRRSMAFSMPIYHAELRMLVRRADGIDSLAELAGRPVAFIDRTTAETRLTDRAHSLGVKPSRAIGPDAALGQLKLGWVGGYVRDDVLLAQQLAALPDRADYQMLPENLGSEPLAIAFNAGDPALARVVEEALTEAARSGEWEKLYDKWFLQPVQGRTLGLAMSPALKAGIDALKTPR